jgi:hypothetical protein
MPDPMEVERQSRKSRSESLLKAEGMPINDWLPAIETASESKLRSPVEIARRAVCLLIVAGRASGLPDDIVKSLIAKHGVSGNFTESEEAFLANVSPSVDSQLQLSWRVEAAWVLLWALGFVENLGLPCDQTEPDRAIELVEKNGLSGLIGNALPRSLSAVLDEADLIYRCHWAVRNDEINNTSEADEFLDPGITRERHWALNWLICSDDQEWDDVTTDT